MSNPSAPTLAARRAAILEDIASAAKAGGRTSADVTLVAVSKLQPETRIEEALGAGQRVFGEKPGARRPLPAGSMRRATTPELELRLVGPLQTNKAEDAVALFDGDRDAGPGKARPRHPQGHGKDRPHPRASTCRLIPARNRKRPHCAQRRVPAFVAEMRALMPQGIEGLMCIPAGGRTGEPAFRRQAPKCALLGMKRG